jgi:sterol desaturase/sphingolipid hydroxylase (fatty acid hydroxylase superfamily)
MLQGAAGADLLRKTFPWCVMLAVIIGIGVGFVIVERLWPASALPRVRAWYPRIVLINAIQAGIVFLAGISWDRWLGRASLVRLDGLLPVLGQALVAYLVSTFVYYWWHRWRHSSQFWWTVCHQLHHSPRRIEVLTSFYKHPVEITINSVLSAAIVYALLGVSVEAAALYTVFTAIAEFFYHWNVRTPLWLGPIFQRPESHRVHHKRNYHTNNYSDLPIFDIIFGTYENPRDPVRQCGFEPVGEDRFEDLLAFRDVNDAKVAASSPLHLLPTCLGCRKRWACAESRGVLDERDVMQEPSDREPTRAA